MRHPGLTPSSWLQRATGLATALLLPCLFILSGVSSAEPATDLQYASELQKATELKIYKQRFEVDANVLCRVYQKRPTFCTANIGSAISDTVEPEMIFKYTAVILDEQEYPVETTPQGGLKFRTDKINYSGPQLLEVEVIYIK